MVFVTMSLFTDDLLAAKNWPENGVRGVTTKLIAKQRANSQNPGEYLSEATFPQFAAWGVNILRVELEVDETLHSTDSPQHSQDPVREGGSDLSQYIKHFEALEAALVLAEKYKIHILLEAGKVAGRDTGMLYSESDLGGYYRHLLYLWTYVAKRFGTHPWLIGYGFLGEPHTANEVTHWHQDVLPVLIKAIREIDRDTFIVVESAPWALPEGYTSLRPVNDAKLVYSFHFYAPHNYTHQGTGVSRAHLKGKLVYPGVLRMFDGSPKIQWDKEQMRRNVAPVRAFQEKYGVRVLAGEFSAIRWAPGAARWLADSISLFEEYGWSWCYHSYGGWNGWNPTFDAGDVTNNEVNGGKETDRLRVLKEGWSRNRNTRPPLSRRGTAAVMQD